MASTNGQLTTMGNLFPCQKTISLYTTFPCTDIALLLSWDSLCHITQRYSYNVSLRNQSIQYKSRVR